MTSDLELIKAIQENYKKGCTDSKPLVELVSRHTGLYANIVNQFAGYSSAINKDDLLDERLSNIWDYAKEYDESRGMKFSTYLGQRVKFTCQTILSKQKIETSDVSNNLPEPRDFMDAEEARDDIAEIMSHTEESKDKLFRRILKMRGDKMTWAVIGEKTGYSYEWVRKVYYKRLDELKKKVLS